MSEQSAPANTLSQSSLTLSELCDACLRLTRASWTKTPKDWFPADSDTAWIVNSASDPANQKEVDRVPCGHDLAEYNGPFRTLARGLLQQPEIAKDGPRPSFHINLHEVKARSQRCHLCSALYHEFRYHCRVRSQKALQLAKIPEDEFGCVELLPTLRTAYGLTTYPWDEDRVQRIPARTLTFHLLHRRRLDQHLDQDLLLTYHLFEDLEPNLKKSLFDSRIQTVHTGATDPGLGFKIKQGTLPRLQAWLEDCSRHHKTCHDFKAILGPRSGGCFNPTRLLEISMADTATVKLRETALLGQVVDYVTLSHRWPLKLDSLLNVDSYGPLSQGIPLNTLPQTFRDAALMTVAMQYRYIWIDSLCIQQDSKDDWIQESAMMASVYTHGVVNLAATYAKDSYGGLFEQSRNPFERRPLTISTSWGDPLHRRQDYVLLNSDRWSDQVERAELNSRGWVFQESTLAPRIIHFARDQIRWSCKTIREAEQVCSHRGKAAVRMEDPEEYEDNFSEDGWFHIIDFYKMRHFTRSSDVFAAIGGVARAFAAFNGYTEADYLMGIWKPRFAQQLLWYAEGQHKRTAPHAPSWSWASIDGAFDVARGECWLPSDNVQIHPDAQAMNGSPGYPSEETFVHPKVWKLYMKGLLHKIVLDGDNQAQEVVGTSLAGSLEALAVSSSKPAGKEPNVQSARKYRRLTIAGTILSACVRENWLLCPGAEEGGIDGQWNRFHLELDEESSNEELHAFFLPLLQVVDPGWAPMAAVHGLLLERYGDGAGTYRRLGRLQICPGKKDLSDLTGLPQWWRGADLSPDEYKVNHGHGCYEFDIV